MDIERHQAELKVVLDATMPRLAAMHSLLLIEPVSTWARMGGDGVVRLFSHRLGSRGMGLSHPSGPHED